MIKDALIVLLKELITKFIFLMRNDKKRKFHEYIKDKNNIQKDIYEILEEMLNKKIKDSKILEEVKKLSTEQKKDIIDYVIKVKNPDFICYSNKDDINIKIIETLSKEIYYRESVIKKIKEYNHKIIYSSPCVYIFKSLEVFKKEDFFTILNKISCINFFILNCSKFNYTEDEKEKLQKMFNDYYFGEDHLTIENIEEIKEKTSLCNIFPKIYKSTRINKDNFNFFVKNIKNIKKDNLKCEIIFNAFFNQTKEKLNTELYLEFFNENRDLIKIFEEFLKENINNSNPFTPKKDQDYEFVLGLAEKLIFEKELKNF